MQCWRTFSWMTCKHKGVSDEWRPVDTWIANGQTTHFCFKVRVSFSTCVGIVFTNWRSGNIGKVKGCEWCITWCSLSCCATRGWLLSSAILCLVLQWSNQFNKCQQIPYFNWKTSFFVYWIGHNTQEFELKSKKVGSCVMCPIVWMQKSRNKLA